MELHLSGRRALVTGASGAIGEAIATRLAVEGASVVAHGVDKDRVEQVVATSPRPNYRIDGGSTTSIN